MTMFMRGAVASLVAPEAFAVIVTGPGWASVM